MANIDRKILNIFWTTWGISLKLSGKMWLMIILSHKTQGGGSNWPPTVLGLSMVWGFFVKTLVKENSNIWLGHQGNCLNSKQITHWWKDVFNWKVVLNVAKVGHVSTSKLLLISSGKCFLFYLQGTWIEIVINKKVAFRVSLELLSIYLRYLHQNQNLSIQSSWSYLQLFGGMQQKRLKFIQSKQKGSVDVNPN